VLQSFIIDFAITGRQLEARFDQGLVPFLIYVCALVFFLVSLRFVLGLSRWPLANLFLGALAYRGILAMETFLNTLEVQEFINSLVGDLVPLPYFSPMIFVFLGLLVYLYTFLSFLARRKV
jgi:hypothetical protein